MRLTDLDKIEICQKYQDGVSGYLLAKKYCTNNQNIYALLKRRGINRRTTRKYIYDFTYFDDVNSEEKAYWLGNLYADGNIYKSTLQLKLGAIDKCQVEAFKNSIQAKNPIVYIKSKNAYVLKISDINLPKKLTKLGMGPNKSHIIEKPPIKDTFLLHFIRGFFDGDGWITKSVGTETRRPYFSLGFSSCSVPFLKFIRFHINQGGSICTKKSGVSQLQYTGNKIVLSVCSLLYKNSSVCLHRKYQQFELLKTISKIKKGAAWKAYCLNELCYMDFPTEDFKIFDDEGKEAVLT